MAERGTTGPPPRSSIDLLRLGVGLLLFAAVVVSWVYFASFVECPDESGPCDGDDVRAPGLAVFYVTTLIGPMAFAVTLSAFPREEPPIGKNWVLWVAALVLLGASALLNLVFASFITVVGLGNTDVFSWGAFTLTAASLLGAVANGLVGMKVFRMLLRRQRDERGAQITPGGNRLYARFALASGAALLVATVVLGGFGLFAGLLLVSLAFMLLPRAGIGGVRDRL